MTLRTSGDAANVRTLPDLTIRPAGDAAVMIDLGDGIDLTLNRRVHALAAHLSRALGHLGPVEVVPGYASILVSYDPRRLCFDVVADAARAGSAGDDRTTAQTRRFILPVAYGGEFGPDLEELASRSGLKPDEVVARHANRDYPVFCVGFAPGFPFLGGLDPALHTPRLDTPRPSVPAGSVAIGGEQTGVYPASMPGGWRLIGRTPSLLFDSGVMPPVPYGPGNVIRFQPMDPGDFEHIRSLRIMPTAEQLIAET